jgi:hypothetical protein
MSRRLVYIAFGAAVGVLVVHRATQAAKRFTPAGVQSSIAGSLGGLTDAIREFTAELKVAMAYGMLPAGAGTTADGRTAADNATVRNVYVIGPDKKIKLVISYPMTTGRNFDEVLRVIDSLQLGAKHKVATPANWKPGEDVIIAGSVSDEDAKKTFGTWAAPKPYIRIVPQPQG